MPRSLYRVDFVSPKLGVLSNLWRRTTMQIQRSFTNKTKRKLCFWFFCGSPLMAHQLCICLKADEDASQRETLSCFVYLFFTFCHFSFVYLMISPCKWMAAILSYFLCFFASPCGCVCVYRPWISFSDDAASYKWVLTLNSEPESHFWGHVTGRLTASVVRYR